MSDTLIQELVSGDIRMVNSAYNDPERDVEISSPYRGNIRCRKLVVSQSGSIVGNIEAHDVRNFGRMNGVVNATDVFINADQARFRGSVFAPHLGIHPNSVFEASGSNSKRFDVASSSPVSPSAIEAAVQEGIRRALGRQGFGLADDQGFVVSPDTTFARPEPTASAPPTPPSTTIIAADQVHNGEHVEDADREPFVEFNWAPPAAARTLVTQEQPRPLPPLFGPGK